MTKFLFTMLPANDLGLPTRLVPIARALADRGHDVAVFNPAPVPAKLVDDAGLKNLPMPSRPMPGSSDDLAQASSAWDVEQMFGALFGNEEFVRAATAANVDVVRDFDPDVVVDSVGLSRALPRAFSRCRSQACCREIFIRRAMGFCGGKVSARRGCLLQRQSSTRWQRRTVLRQ
jgi:UDP:flavonoid glycosyltransferase YjiC (YdhE family)